MNEMKIGEEEMRGRPLTCGAVLCFMTSRPLAQPQQTSNYCGKCLVNALSKFSSYKITIFFKKSFK